MFQAGDITISTPSGPPVATTFTSGSWCWEGRYAIPETELTSSLFRIERDDNVLVNLVSMRGEGLAGPDFNIKLFLDGHNQSSLNGDGESTEAVVLELPNVNIWDGNPWYISVNNEYGGTENTVSVRCAKVSGNYLVEHYSGSINYTKGPPSGPNTVSQRNIALPLSEINLSLIHI